MAIYHMQAKVVSRGSGRSAVAASAYMSCSHMYNDYDGIQHDYTRKQGLIYQEVMLPPMAPLEWNDREQLRYANETEQKLKYLPFKLGIMDIQRITELGWRAQVGLNDAFRYTLESFMQMNK